VDDYGHHPTEIAATLQTAKTFDRKRLVVVFQPHRYSRTKFLMNEFAGCFNLADHLVLMDIYPASEKPIEGVTTEVLMEKIREKRPQEILHLKKDQVVDHLMGVLRPGDLMLTLGAGDITQISDDLARRLAQRAALGQGRGVIGVIMGGCSSERDVSLRSGSAIVAALTGAGCTVKALDLQSDDHDTVKEWLKGEKIDMAFIALHGRFGEDGGIQTVLEELNIPYNGCNPSSSYAAFNKCVAQKLFEGHQVRTPLTIMVSGLEGFDAHQAVARLGGFPLVVKPACEGSSIGISFATDHDSFTAALSKAYEYGPDIVIQQCIKGRELTVGILGVQVLPVVEIRAVDTEFFDFQAKYKNKTTEYLVPAPLSAETASRVQAEALKAYKALGCEGFGRVDVLLGDHDEPYVLEVNTIPGFTATSLLPKAARSAGIDFIQLCLTLVDMAYGKKKAESLPKS
jgi:UDP-N-acetylmuramate--alanine ligase